MRATKRELHDDSEGGIRRRPGERSHVRSVAKQFTVEWDPEADVVVRGAGAMGVTAVLTARDEGASVIVLEKADEVGGALLGRPREHWQWAHRRIWPSIRRIPSAPSTATCSTTRPTNVKRPAMMHRLADESPGVMERLGGKGAKFIGMAEVAAPQGGISAAQRDASYR